MKERPSRLATVMSIPSVPASIEKMIALEERLDEQVQLLRRFEQAMLASTDKLETIQRQTVVLLEPLAKMCEAIAEQHQSLVRLAQETHAAATHAARVAERAASELKSSAQAMQETAYTFASWCTPSVARRPAGAE